MACTRFSIAEQALLRLKGGRPDLAFKTDIRDLIASVGQLINQYGSENYYNTTLPSGETIPDGGMMFEYENVAVVQWKNTACSILPAYPIYLPRGMGVFQISTPDDPFTVFIPTLPGQIAILQSQTMISDLFNHVAFEWTGNRIIYNRDITLESITAVSLLLVVSDMSNLSDTDILPIPANMENRVVNELFQQFGGQLPADEKNDVLTDKTTGK